MKKFLSFCVTLVLLLTMVPAATTEADAATMDRGFIALDRDESAIAPGVEQTIATVRKKYNQQQMVYYTMTVDTEGGRNRICLNFKDNDWEAYQHGQYGLQEVSKQMDAAQKNHADDPNFTIVGGINGTGYNMSSGESNSYILVSGGEVINKPSASQSFFAVRKSGKAFIGWDDQAYNDAMSSEDPIVEAIGMFINPLVKENDIVAKDWSTSGTPDNNARTAIGVKEDGDVVMLVVDGKQAPYSEGCDMYELAEILKGAGCKDAFNLDGGGSSTYVSRSEGESTYRVQNRPCDGYPRAVGTSLYVASTYVSEKRFDHAALTADNEYITPGGTVNLTAKGVNPAGAPVDVPEDVTWQLSDDSYGTVDGDSSGATFTSNGQKEGEVQIQMMYEGEVAGSATIHVVKPTKFEFKRESYAAPYGETFDLDFNVKYEEKDGQGDVTAEHDVAFHKGDVTLSVDPATAGKFDFTTFTAANKTNGLQASATFTAKTNFDGISDDTAAFKFVEGSGTTTVYDFENPKDSDNFVIDLGKYSGEIGMTAGIVDNQNGMVHDGSHSLKITVDYSELQSTAIGAGVWQTVVSDNTKSNDTSFSLKDATGIGYWIWIPDEDEWTEVQIRALSKNSEGTFSGITTAGNSREGVNYDEGRWCYVYMDLSDFAGQDLYINPRWFSVMLWGQTSGMDPIMSVNNKLTYYVDSYTVDYATVHDDRTMPVIGNVTDADSGGVLTREEPYDFGDTNTVSFTAPVSDAAEGRNYGINVGSAEAYIDGREIVASVQDGTIVTEPATLAPGEHTLKLYISDKSGNTTNATRRFTISSGNAATVQLVPSEKNKYKDQIPIHSVFYMDVQATDISKIQEVTMEMDLNNISTWELDHAEVNPNFEMTVSREGFYAEDENIAKVTFKRKAEQIDYESDVIASLPVRTWDGEFTQEQAKTAWSNKQFFPVDVSVEVDRGEIEYVDGYNPGTLPIFGGGVQVDTELYNFAEVVVPAEGESKTSWHFHDSAHETVDKDENCTEFGYTGREICKTCGSPVVWGTVKPPTGHKYEIGEDGKRTCSVCGAAFTGEYDGKTYEEGEVVSNKWVENSYYVGGKKVTGVYAISEVKDAETGETADRYYDFGEDGVCKNRDGITGFFKKDAKSKDTYYAEGGFLRPGWLYLQPEEIDPNWDDDEKKAHLDVYHVGEDGKVHTDENGQYEKGAAIIVDDQRTCTGNNFIFYTCKGCGAHDQSELLWSKGHVWEDPEHGVYHCTVCGTDGIDIAGAELRTAGLFFTYTGNAIRAKHSLTYNGRLLSIASDRRGHDGLSTFNDNTEIGVATIIVSGRGDFYGEKIGHFEIVPANVTDLTVTGGEGHALTLQWSAPLGAESYDIERLDADGEWQRVVENVADTTYTFTDVEPGSDYGFRVCSRADAPDKTNGGAVRTFYSSQWSNEVVGTLEHDWNEPTAYTPPTCTAEGSVTHTCKTKGCEYHETPLTEVVPALGHSVPEDGWTVTKEPTTTEEGERTGVCGRCGETVTEKIEKLPPVHTGTGGSTAPGNKQDTVTNPDGSVTTTTTKADGTTTKSTKYPDGTVSEKTTDKDGTVTETTKRPDGEVTEKVTQPDGSGMERRTTPEGVTGQVSTNSKGKVTAADVTIPESVKSGFVTAPVEVPAAKSTQEAPEINLKVGSADTGKVEIPVTEFGPGTVAILVHEDGTEEVVRDCTIGENGVILNVEGDVTLKIVERSQNFTDVASGNWASDAVEFVAARELFQGTGNQQFTPEGNMTRGMLVTVLYRLAYEPEAAQVDFGDIDQQAYYSDAVAWAASNGVVTGYSDHAFGPDDDITREQLATILYRYAKNHTAATGQTAALSTFADASQISPYAAEAMSWAVSSGLINGVGNNQLAPEGEATRAQVATMLMRFCENTMK